MSATMDIIVSAQDQASDVIEGIGDTVEETGSWIDNNWGKVTAATAAAGAASEGFARSQADTNATLGRMAHRTGESEDSLRSMIDGMVDATFSAHDAAAGMEALSARGVDNKDDFEALLPTFDSFADATGKDMVQGIEEVSRVLGAFNIPVEEAGDHIDTMTHLSENLGIPLDRLGRQLGNNTEELDAMNIGVDESAALLQALRDRGMDGRDAMKLFTEQVREADGDQDALLEGLGLTAAEFEEYQGKVAAAAGITDEFAAINNATMTPIERMQANLENLMARYGGLADAAGMAAPVLMAMGPAMRGVSLATRGLGAAMSFLAANPIVLVIAAIAALAAGLVYAYQNSETFRDIVSAVFEHVGAVARWLWESVLEPVWGLIQAGFDVLMTVAQAYWEVWKTVFTAAGEVVMWLWDNAIKPVWDRVQRGFDVVKIAAQAYWELWRSVFDRVGSVVRTVWEDWIRPAWDAITDGLGWVGDKAGELRDGWTTAMDGIREGARAIVNPIIGFFNAIIGGVESLVNSIARGVNSLPSISIPDVPGMPGRGETISIPNVPTLSIGRIPTLHAGGVFRAPAGRSEGLALLSDLERVTTPQQESEMSGLLRELVTELRSNRGRPIEMNVQAWSERFSLRQIEDELAMHGAV